MRNRFHKTSPPENPSTSMRVPPVPEDPDKRWPGVRPEIQQSIEEMDVLRVRWAKQRRRRAVSHGIGTALYVVGYTLVQIVMVSAVVVFGMLAASGVGNQSKWD